MSLQIRVVNLNGIADKFIKRKINKAERVEIRE
jgi:hypothetical protein